MSAPVEFTDVSTWSHNRVFEGLRGRLKGPGGYYNAGNAVGLAVGLLLQVRGAGGDNRGLAQSVEAYFIGDWAAVALTVATIIFFWSGEEYHQAWANGFPPDARKTRRGDRLSGVGATLLGVGLLMIGDPLLAATSGLLHAAGKFGSALNLRAIHVNERWTPVFHDMFRWAVVASRLPAILIGLIGLGVSLTASSGIDADSLLMPATLLACYALWTCADLMLLRPSRG